jgi:hypothetical protein
MEQAAYSLNDFCKRYGICRETARKQIRAGALKARKLGKKVIVLKADAEKWAASLPAPKYRASA